MRILVREGLRSPNLKGGFTLLELAIAMAILLIALLAVVGAIFVGQKGNSASREVTIAMNACRLKIEEMQSIPFNTVYSAYQGANATWSVTTLPAGTGTVAGLPSGTGTVLFPQVGAALREDFVDARLGMPHDLNGDGIIDQSDHSGDYVILPVHIQISWLGTYGNQKYDMFTCLYPH